MNLKSITIAVDVMGGDHGYTILVPACIQVALKNPQLRLLLVGQKEPLQALLKQLNPSCLSQLSIVPATEVVSMDELPSQALRNKKDSSMRVAIQLVKEGKAEACVSAGNTGALMATARFVLKTLPGIERPAIMAELPSVNGITRVIDLGANVDSCAEHLFQFAVMGSAFIQAVDQKKRPKVGLLNIGVEEIKGNEQVKRTAQILADCDLINYIGYVEGDQLYLGEVDLVVCDGFVGNVALKASEGLAKLLLGALQSSFSKNFFTKLLGFLSLPILKQVKKRMDPAQYNGASLLGLNGIVIKSHGGATGFAFEHAIEEAARQVKNDVVALTRSQISDFLNQGLLL